jgi:hypothetical protein
MLNFKETVPSSENLDDSNLVSSYQLIHSLCFLSWIILSKLKGSRPFKFDKLYFNVSVTRLILYDAHKGQYILPERWWCSQFRAAFLWKNLKIKFNLASLISLTNFEYPSSNRPQEACCGFQIAAFDSKSCSESRQLFWKLFRVLAICSVEKIDQGQRR